MNISRRDLTGPSIVLGLVVAGILEPGQPML
jgi:hypothetical protein